LIHYSLRVEIVAVLTTEGTGFLAQFCAILSEIPAFVRAGLDLRFSAKA
jgi:hypothetical protein